MVTDRAGTQKSISLSKLTYTKPIIEVKQVLKKMSERVAYITNMFPLARMNSFYKCLYLRPTYIQQKVSYAIFWN